MLHCIYLAPLPCLKKVNLRKKHSSVENKHSFIHLFIYSPAVVVKLTYVESVYAHLRS